MGHYLFAVMELYFSSVAKLVAKCFFQLKVVLGPCIEVLILLDRLCYLKEQVILSNVTQQNNTFSY